jgi:hypothetical protein
VLRPSVLRRIVRLSPTTTQVLGRGQATPFRVRVVPLGWLLAAGAAGRADKWPLSGGATSTSGSSTDSNRSRDSPQNIAAPPSLVAIYLDIFNLFLNLLTIRQEILGNSRD